MKKKLGNKVNKRSLKKASCKLKRFNALIECNFTKRCSNKSAGFDFFAVIAYRQRDIRFGEIFKRTTFNYCKNSLQK